MLWIGKKKVARLWIGSREISALYRGSVKIFGGSGADSWSCFGSGVWLSQKPWIGTDKWKNNR